MASLDRLLTGPVSFLLLWMLAMVAAVVISTYLYPDRWKTPVSASLHDRLRRAARTITRSVVLWLLPFTIGITVTFGIAIWMGQSFDRLPYPVPTLIALYIGSSLLAFWLLRRMFPGYGRDQTEPEHEKD